MVRLLTHISERKIQRIIKTGIERGDIIVINKKNSQYQGTKQLLNLYKEFEKFKDKLVKFPKLYISDGIPEN